MTDDRAPSEPRDVLTTLAVLAEPTRRRLYEWVVARPEPAGRDDAAAALGIGRPLVAFHLDRLVEAGLLETEYRRRGGRTGPGAGRPAKLYRRATTELAVSVPPRRYDVAAALLAEGLEGLERLEGLGSAIGTGGASDPAPPSPLRRAAARRGTRLGEAGRRGLGPRPSRLRTRAALVAILADQGYAPRELGSGGIGLGNCPFAGLVEAHRDLVCGANLAMAEGILRGLGANGLDVRLDPQPDACCVVFGDEPRN